MIEALANVQFPDWTWPYLNATRLIGISEGPKVRPLGIGDYLLRTASTARVRTLTHADYAKVFLRPDLRVFQLGSGVKAGVEAAFHLVRLLLDANPDWICIKGDCSNGYNSPDATCMLAAVARLFPSQSLFVNYKYSRETQMFTRDRIISRQCGSIQGDPHGGLCFDAVFQGVLERAAEAGAHPSRELCSAFAHPADAAPSLHIVAVHDDTWFWPLLRRSRP